MPMLVSSIRELGEMLDMIEMAITEELADG